MSAREGIEAKYMTAFLGFAVYDSGIAPDVADNTDVPVIASIKSYAE